MDDDYRSTAQYTGTSGNFQSITPDRSGTRLTRQDQRKYIFIFWNICYSADQGGKQMKEILLLLGFLAFWIVLQKYILPRLGVQT